MDSLLQQSMGGEGGEEQADGDAASMRSETGSSSGGGGLGGGLFSRARKGSSSPSRPKYVTLTLALTLINL
jgi:hypothetical protein